MILQVNSFKNPFEEITWLFTRITGQETTTNISCMIIYILYLVVKEHAIFNWGKFISIEISSQLSQYKEKKIFMSSYLVFAIAHCCHFLRLSMCKRNKTSQNFIEFLMRHKASQQPSGIKHYGGTKPPNIFMKFLMILSQFLMILCQFLKTCCLERMLPECLTR
jgi:hypothetical protein